MKPADLVITHCRFARLVASREGKGHGVWRLVDMADLEQAAMLGLWRAAQTWNPALGAFSTWAGWECRAQVQAEIRRLRGRGSARMPTIEPFEDDIMSTDWLGGVEALEEEQAQLEERSRSVGRAIEALTEDDRQLLLRRFRDGVSGSQIATERNVSPQAVSKRLRRILGVVRQEVGA